MTRWTNVYPTYHRDQPPPDGRSWARTMHQCPARQHTWLPTVDALTDLFHGLVDTGVMNHDDVIIDVTLARGDGVFWWTVEFWTHPKDEQG